jgi:hypothetical protein
LQLEDGESETDRPRILDLQPFPTEKMAQWTNSRVQPATLDRSPQLDSASIRVPQTKISQCRKMKPKSGRGKRHDQIKWRQHHLTVRWNHGKLNQQCDGIWSPGTWPQNPKLRKDEKHDNGR